ncbi:M20/M25/M40 family metallo-hydrolase [Legionella sp. CNM-1927-20]|uniref:M20/M25/M40 family metallo-hydrolase n=1 Tax=Legionella sp. CNM-1927-20 TaxID=3422221 RepID=UPI00403AE917
MPLKRNYRWSWFIIIVCLLLLLGTVYMLTMPGRSYRGPFLPLTTLEEEIAKLTKKHILVLAEEIGERNLWHERNLSAAANYIEKEFTSLGYQVISQEYLAQNKPVRNIIAEHKGSKLVDEIIIIGAHYDTVFGSPGADDNGSGVAALLELARLLKDNPTKRTIRFVAFVNEEPPFFQTPEMGSFYYANSLREKNVNVVAMLSLESIGYYSTAENSQNYPFPFSYFYPDTADFIGFVANVSSRSLLQKVIASFRKHSSFPSEGLAAPSGVTGVGWSDQWAFWQKGYPAIMVTGTALFRNPNYHRESDLPNTIDYARLARVIDGLYKVILDLSER